MTDSTPDIINEFYAKKRSPAFRFLAVFVSLGLVLLSIQTYFYFLHPEPVNIPTLSQVQQFLSNDLGQAFSSHSPDEVRQVVNETRDTIKQVANFVAAQSCKNSNKVCQSKALFYFVRDEIRYVSDDNFHDQLQNPLATLKNGGADCEDMAVLLIALQKAIGNRARLVFVPGHAYAQVSIEGYKNERWVNLEATCAGCKFGELPSNTGIQKKEYFQI